MVKDLQNTKSSSASENVDAPVSKIIADFERNMNSDLNVKSAFDRLYEKVSELHKKRKSLRAEDITNALNDLPQD